MRAVMSALVGGREIHGGMLARELRIGKASVLLPDRRLPADLHGVFATANPKQLTAAHESVDNSFD